VKIAGNLKHLCAKLRFTVLREVSMLTNVPTFAISVFGVTLPKTGPDLTRLFLIGFTFITQWTYGPSPSLMPSDFMYMYMFLLQCYGVIENSAYTSNHQKKKKALCHKKIEQPEINMHSFTTVELDGSL
jgi:hypothetical protein